MKSYICRFYLFHRQPKQFNVRRAEEYCCTSDPQNNEAYYSTQPCHHSWKAPTWGLPPRAIILVCWAVMCYLLFIVYSLSCLCDLLLLLYVSSCYARSPNFFSWSRCYARSPMHSLFVELWRAISYSFFLRRSYNILRRGQVGTVTWSLPVRRRRRKFLMMHCTDPGTPLS